jgi:hypothetical protein
VRKRRLLLGVIALALLLLGAGLLAWLSAQAYRVTPESREQLLGLFGKQVTLAEVEAILGGPAHRFGPPDEEPDGPFGMIRYGNGEREGWTWYGDECTLFVSLDDDGRLDDLIFVQHQKASIWVRLRRSLPW